MLFVSAVISDENSVIKNTTKPHQKMIDFLLNPNIFQSLQTKGRKKGEHTFDKRTRKKQNKTKSIQVPEIKQIAQLTFSITRLCDTRF